MRCVHRPAVARRSVRASVSLPLLRTASGYAIFEVKAQAGRLAADGDEDAFRDRRIDPRADHDRTPRRVEARGRREFQVPGPLELEGVIVPHADDLPFD